MTNLPPLGTLSYATPNNQTVYTFSVVTRSKIHKEFAWSDSRRVKKYDRIRLSVAGYIDLDGASSLDANMTNLRNILCAPGGNLVYSGHGFGGPNANALKVGPAPGYSRDAEFGPRPELLNFVPIGAGITAYVEWDVTVCVASCPPPANPSSQFTMVDYGLSFAIENGYTKITHTVIAEIPMSRTANNQIPDDIDNYYHLLAPPIPTGFSRAMTPQDRKLSLDRRRIECTFVDVEQAYPLPDGCSAMEFEHHTRASMTGNREVPGAFAVAICQIRATVRLPKSAPPALAMQKFLTALAPRIEAMVFTPPNPASGRRGRGRVVWPTDVDYRESGVFDNPVSTFSVTVRVMGTSLTTLLVDTGMYVYPNTNYVSWAQSMADSGQHPRGSARIQVGAVNDALVDLCIQAPTTPNRQPPVGGGGQRGGGRPDIPGQVPPPPGGSGPRFPNRPFRPSRPVPPPPPQDCWLWYRIWWEYDQKDLVAIHVPLVQPQNLLIAPSPTGPLNLISRDPGPTQTGTGEAIPNIIQQVGPPLKDLILRGEAIRVGYEINPPRLISLFGRAVTQLEQQLTPVNLGTLGGFVLHGLTWAIRYSLDKTPPVLPDLANPELSLDGGEQPSTAGVAVPLDLLLNTAIPGG